MLRFNTAIDFSLLSANPEGMDPSLLGGSFALPPEFDTGQYAAHWAQDGAEILALQRPQQLVGTNFTAMGWVVWTYPDTQPGGKKGEEVKHPLAGQRHAATLREKNGGTYVLMCRPRKVQDQVTLVYAKLSRERLAVEMDGPNPETLEDTSGMLGEAQLTKVLGTEGRDSEDNQVDLVPHHKVPVIQKTLRGETTRIRRTMGATKTKTK